jgi:predicted dehydrogenase
MFGGGVYVQRRGGERREVALTHYYGDRNRGLGVADIAYAIRNGRAPRASGDLMYRVHDVMHAIHDASREGRHVFPESHVQRPAPFPAGYTTPIFEQAG